jgi:coenzyme F420-reducing hydrogenase alpha subunit
MKTLSLQPLTRVEGNGRVELKVQSGRLAAVRLVITESPRLFEGLLLGRTWQEVPALVCRICAICSGVHRIAAAAALESALGIDIPAAARKVRELLLLGGHIESHALHLFCLILPDLAGAESILELLRAGDSRARDGLQLKALGNHIQEIAGGRVIHPVNVEVGGIVRLPLREKLEVLQAELEEWPERLLPLVEVFADYRGYPPATAAHGTRIAVDGDNFLLTGQSLRLSDGRVVAGDRYPEVLEETAVPWSNTKHSRTKVVPLLAGALARLENAAGLASAPMLPETSGLGIHANNLAQGVELLWALREARRLVRELLAADADAAVMAAVRPGAGVGTCLIEAPRGLLIHHYALDDQGRVAAADIVTPTAINQAAIEAQLFSDLQEVTDETLLRERAARIVRAYDPCISCSVHVIDKNGSLVPGPKSKVRG